MGETGGGTFREWLAATADGIQGGESVDAGFLVPPQYIHGYYLPLTRWERVRNRILRAFRRPVPPPTWWPGLLALAARDDGEAGDGL